MPIAAVSKVGVPEDFETFRMTATDLFHMVMNLNVLSYLL